MYRTVCLFLLAACAAAQQYQSDPRTAAILSESRHLSGDGSFGSSYTQEDGVEFKEESLPDGTRRGTYSYVDPTGQRKTVSYTAGKHGFQATGDHIPSGGEQQAPVPSYTPLPEYNPPEYYDESPARPSYQPQYRAPAPVRPQYNPAPQPQYRPQPQYNPAPQPQYRPQPQYNPAPQPQYNPAPQPQYNPAPQPQYRPSPAPSYYSTTPAPHRFFPPGKLSLNRLPDGYSYTFNKA